MAVDLRCGEYGTAEMTALRGAEMILMPIWGGNEVLGKARAIENGPELTPAKVRDGDFLGPNPDDAALHGAPTLPWRSTQPRAV